MQTKNCKKRRAVLYVQPDDYAALKRRLATLPKPKSLSGWFGEMVAREIAKERT